VEVLGPPNDRIGRQLAARTRSLTSAKKAGGSLKLVNPSKPALQTLKMGNLLPFFDVYTEEDEAVQSFALSRDFRCLVTHYQLPTHILFDPQLFGTTQ